jgi:hypothetical protein
MSAPPNTEMMLSPTSFVGKIAGRCYSVGYMIPAIIVCLLKLRIELLSNETGAEMCGVLDFIWPTTSSNFSRMVGLGFVVEANAYALLVLITAAYAAVTLLIVFKRYANMRKRIQQLDLRQDVIPGVLFTIIFIIAPRVYQVQEEFKRLSDFYIDQYGFLVFKNYIILLALFLIPFFAVYIIKIAEGLCRKQQA